MNCLNFFQNIFNCKVIKIYCIVRCSSVITIHKESYSMSYYWFKHIKIYYICPIFYIRLIFSWIKTITFRFIFIILLYFKICSKMKRHKKFWSALIVPSPARNVAVRFNRIPNKVASNVPKNIPRNLLFCSFDSVLIASLTVFMNKPHFSSDLTIFLILVRGGSRKLMPMNYFSGIFLRFC